LTELKFHIDRRINIKYEYTEHLALRIPHR
jgi:hypothetical protein